MPSSASSTTTPISKLSSPSSRAGRRRSRPRSPNPPRTRATTSRRCRPRPRRRPNRRDRLPMVIDLIQYTDEYAGEIVHRVPESGSGEFRLGSQLVVRESQRAVFFRDGKALDVFGPGRHTISTNNIPFLTGLIGAITGGTSMFTAEVYFVSMREFTDMKWGTAQPVAFRDADLGMVRLRAFGTYTMRVDDPQLFVGQIVGARGSYG